MKILVTFVVATLGFSTAQRPLDPSGRRAGVAYSGGVAGDRSKEDYGGAQVESYTMAAHIALMVLRSRFPARLLASNDVLLIPETRPVPENEAAERLGFLAASLAPTPVWCESRIVGGVLGVQCAGIQSEAEASEHREIANLAAADVKARYGSRPQGPEVVVLFRGEQHRVRWDDIRTFWRSFAGEAWGGAVAAPDDELQFEPSICAVFVPGPAGIAIPKAPKPPGSN